MNLLVIDTTTNILKIGLCINNKKSYIDLDEGYKHVEKLLPNIQKCIDEIKQDKLKI